MPAFESQGLSFEIDRAGVSIDEPEEIQLSVEYSDLGTDEASAPFDLGERLSALAKEKVVDEEGIFDLAVYRGRELVAALVLACEEDALALGGERVSGVEDEQLAEAIVAALSARPLA